MPHEWLPPSTPTEDHILRLDWLSEEVVEGVLLEARLAAVHCKRYPIRFQETLQTDKRIIRLAAKGNTMPASLKWLLSTTQVSTQRACKVCSRKPLSKLVHASITTKNIYARLFVLGHEVNRRADTANRWPSRRKGQGTTNKTATYRSEVDVCTVLVYPYR